MTVPVSYTCADNTDIQLTLQQPFIPKEAPKMCDGNEAITHCQSSSPPHCCQACHQHWCVYMCVYVRRAGIDQGPQCCAFVALFPGSSPLPLWWWDLVMVPFGSPTPPLLPISSSLLLPPHLLPHSLAPRLSLHHLLPPPHLLPPSTPSQALGRMRTASALQTQGQKLPAGSHGNSFSLTLSPRPCSVKGSVENRRAPLFFSTLSHSPN